MTSQIMQEAALCPRRESASLPLEVDRMPAPILTRPVSLVEAGVLVCFAILLLREALLPETYVSRSILNIYWQFVIIA